MLNVKEQKDRKVIVSLRDVTKIHGSNETQVHALRKVTLDIYEGEFLVVLGKSGSGKSTLMNIIGGIDTLTEGTFLFDGMDYSHLSERKLTMYRRNSVGYIFQAYNLMPTLTVQENLSFIAELCKGSMKIDKALALVGLQDKKRRYPAQLSGGEQQRVSIARALIKNPRLMLADEPTASLDHATSIAVLSALKEVTEAGTTLIMVTHNEEIAKMANRVIKLKDGQIEDSYINEHPISARELVW